MAERNDVVPVSDEVRRTVLAWFGDDGRAWLERLPALVHRLAGEWELSLGSALAGGSASLVLEVTRRDGTRAVLKVPVLDDENREEAAALRHYDGDGAVRLLEYDRPTGALLIERADPGTPLAALPDRGAAIDLACRLLRRLSRPPAPGHPFPLVRELALSWSTELTARHEGFGCPFGRELVEEAALAARELAEGERDLVVVNRDGHLGNILAATREPWLLIDPKPLVGDPAFDAGHLLFDLLRSSTIEPAALVARVAAGLAVSPARARDWARVRAVENGVWSLSVGEDAEPHLAAARAFARVD